MFSSIANPRRQGFASGAFLLVGVLVTVIALWLGASFWSKATARPHALTVWGKSDLFLRFDPATGRGTLKAFAGEPAVPVTVTTVESPGGVVTPSLTVTLLERSGQAPAGSQLQLNSAPDPSLGPTFVNAQGALYGLPVLWVPASDEQ